MKKLLIALLFAPLMALAQPVTPINNARITGTSSAVTFGIGTGATAPATNFQVIDTGTGTPRGITNDQYNSGTNSAQINLRKARGTFAAPTTVVTGDLLSRLISWGYDGSNFIESGGLRFTSEGTIAATRMPSKFEIYVGTDAAPTVLTSTASFSGSSGISFTALGTNQSITLTPSGTGGVTLSGAGSATLGLLRLPTGTTLATGLAFGTDVFLYRSNTPELTAIATAFRLTSGAGGDNYLDLVSGSSAGDTVHLMRRNSDILSANSTTTTLGIPGTAVFSITSTVATVIGTKTLKFGATAAATIGVDADSGAGILTFTSSAGGNFNFVNPTGEVLLRLVNGATSRAYISTNSTTVDYQATPATMRFFPANNNSFNLTSGGAVVLSTGTIKFGATALASIGVSADTTAGILTLTSPSAGGIFLSAAASNSVVIGATGSTTITAAPVVFHAATNKNVAVDTAGKLYWVVDAGNAYIAGAIDALTMDLRISGTSAITLGTDISSTFGGAIIGGSSQALSGAGAVDVTHLVTQFTSTGGAQALTLANGTSGQMKIIMHVVDGGSGVLTPTTKTGFSTITFINAGDSVHLQYVTTQGWIVVGSYGAVIAP